MEKAKLEQQLENFLQAEVQGVEPSDEWWNRTIAQAGEQKRRSRWSILMPRTRLAWVLLPLILLLIGGTVYGATSLVRELFQKLATDVENAGLAQELDLSQTVNGVTIKLERAYADSNVILLGYTVSGPKSRYYTDFGGLSAADGQEIPGMVGMGTVPGSSLVMGSWPKSQRAAIIAAFDASTIKGTPAEISLRLEISVTDTAIPRESQASVGPFIFDFTLPFNAGTVVDVNQTVEASGIPITLERVVISHWATQAIFSFAPPYDNIKTRSLIIASVEPAGGDIVNVGLGKSKEEASAEYFIGDLTTQSGEWTVSVKELVFPPESPTPGTHPASDTKRLAGPWVFRLQVP
ncbi:MAG: DUF4179 domain-containing protein [Candidatus Omnitrophica bacterium]|nr:DUF4179 domain-containing protein [Candidatus Omnitrophota bacterium]